MSSAARSRPGSASLRSSSLCSLYGIGCASSPLERSLARGVAWFEAHVARADPSWAHVIVYLHRRFGLSLRLRSGELVHADDGSGSRPEIAALYRRLSDPSARADPRAIAALPSQIDRMTALSLYCDQLGLPAGWPELLQRASTTGGYALTHAVLARAWTLENACLPADALASLQREQTERLAELVAQGDGQREPGQASTDQWIEALAMLYYSGARERVRPEWIDALLAAQREDGGWPLEPERRPLGSTCDGTRALGGAREPRARRQADPLDSSTGGRRLAALSLHAAQGRHQHSRNPDSA